MELLAAALDTFLLSIVIDHRKYRPFVATKILTTTNEFEWTDGYPANSMSPTRLRSGGRTLLQENLQEAEVQTEVYPDEEALLSKFSAISKEESMGKSTQDKSTVCVVISCYGRNRNFSSKRTHRKSQPVTDYVV